MRGDREQQANMLLAITPDQRFCQNSGHEVNGGRIE